MIPFLLIVAGLAVILYLLFRPASRRNQPLDSGVDFSGSPSPSGTSSSEAFAGQGGEFGGAGASGSWNDSSVAGSEGGGSDGGGGGD